jgi:hypothetical protein
MLANCPTAGGQLAEVVTQLTPKKEDGLMAAVIEPRVAVLTVTEEDEDAVTEPVTSSTKSNSPVARLEAVGGRTEAVKTFVAVRSTFETT